MLRVLVCDLPVSNSKCVCVFIFRLVYLGVLVSPVPLLSVAWILVSFCFLHNNSYSCAEVTSSLVESLRCTSCRRLPSPPLPQHGLTLKCFGVLECCAPGCQQSSTPLDYSLLYTLLPLMMLPFPTIGAPPSALAGCWPWLVADGLVAQMY